MPCLNVMSRIEDREDDALLFDLGGTEHPTVLFLDAGGEVLGRHDMSDVTVKALEETGGKVKRSLELRKKADAGDAAARIDLAIAQCDLGVIEFFDLEGAVEGVKLGAEQARAVATLRADATVSDMLALLRKDRDEGARKIATEEFLALHKEGARPARTAHRLAYWGLLADHAVSVKDKALLSDAIAELRAILPPDAKRLLDLEEKRKALEQ